MLSRIAESLYWMARHLERADNTARILDINLVYMLEADEGASEETLWKPLLQIVDADRLYLEKHPDGAVTVQRVIHCLTQELDNPGSRYNKQPADSPGECPSCAGSYLSADVGGHQPVLAAGR